MLKDIKYFIWAVILIFFAACQQPEEAKTQEAIGKHRVVETGELAAIDSRAFVLQRYGRHWYQMKIIGLLKHGSEVQPGDSIIQLDPTEIKKYIIDREGDLETQIASLEKMKVDQSNQRSSLESNLKSETATFDLRKLELESARFESARIRKIKQLEFEQAQINFAKVKRQVELYKIRERSELKIQEIRIKRLRDEIKSAYEILPQLTIRTPIEGIFQIGDNQRTRQMLKVGDEIYVGNKMGNVPALKWMKVNTTISENDFLKIAVGQKVIVRLDALPKVEFEGEINYIGKLCRLKDDKSKQKVFDVEVKILKSDERLKPGMTVSCEYLLK
ncbi:MAG: efflux RND transporter periplasmic adaptor subunit [Paludibacteraceae bacterium]|nr:efflux RND transporter periplasmic adaptor subunit [Paludibacteraceae bacterium]